MHHKASSRICKILVCTLMKKLMCQSFFFFIVTSDLNTVFCIVTCFFLSHISWAADLKQILHHLQRNTGICTKTHMWRWQGPGLSNTDNIGLMELLQNWGREGLMKISSQTSHSKQGLFWSYIKFLWVLPSSPLSFHCGCPHIYEEKDGECC